MPKAARKQFIPFGINADTDQCAQIGSLRVGAPLFSKDPDVLQALSNYQSGWFSIAMGTNSPALEDMNAIQFVFAYMIAYMFENGVAEWQSATTYYTGSIVNVGGKLYKSLIDNNTGNAVTDGTKWKPASSVSLNSIVADYTVTNSDDYIHADATSAVGGLITVTLPATGSVADGFKVTIKNASASLSSGTVNVVVSNTGTETFENGYTTTTLTLESGPPVNESVTIYKKGTVWYIV